MANKWFEFTLKRNEDNPMTCIVVLKDEKSDSLFFIYETSLIFILFTPTPLW